MGWRRLAIHRDPSGQQVVPERSGHEQTVRNLRDDPRIGSRPPGTTLGGIPSVVPSASVNHVVSGNVSPGNAAFWPPATIRAAGSGSVGPDESLQPVPDAAIAIATPIESFLVTRMSLSIG